MKKMTVKEFNEALEKADFNMNIYGYEGILNIIICKLYAEVCELEANNDDAEYTEYKRTQANVLHGILEARGYYND